MLFLLSSCIGIKSLPYDISPSIANIEILVPLLFLQLYNNSDITYVHIHAILRHPLVPYYLDDTLRRLARVNPDLLASASFQYCAIMRVYNPFPGRRICRSPLVEKLSVPKLYVVTLRFGRTTSERRGREMIDLLSINDTRFISWGGSARQAVRTALKAPDGRYRGCSHAGRRARPVQ